MRLRVLFLTVYLTACTTPGSIQHDDNLQGVIDNTELRLIEQSKKTLEELESKGYLLEDEKLLTYLNEVGDRVIPKSARSAIHFNILRSSAVNALALPDGNILFTVGLLARLENEAQLAFVLGHEAAHVMKKHSLGFEKSRKKNLIAAHITDLFLLGTSVAYLPFIASVANHSRQHEYEADKIGLELLVNAGYETDAVLNFFDVIEEVKEAESIQGSFYSSHPTNLKRNKFISKLVADEYADHQGVAEKSSYISFRKPLLLRDVKLKLSSRHYQLALETVDRALEGSEDLAIWHFYHGEALRLMGDDPDTAAREYAWLFDRELDDELVDEFTARKKEFYRQAVQSYRKALLISSDLSVAYRGLGLVHYREGRLDEADQYLKQYLELEPQARDKRYIHHVMERIIES